MSLRNVLAGLAVAAMALGGAAAPAAAAVTQSLDSEEFEGLGIASHPAQAIQAARAQAFALAKSAGYIAFHCTPIDSSIEHQEWGPWTATFTISCS